jgi:DNA modification methylase
VYRDRIKEIRKVKASELSPHPLNWRKHPTKQTRALKAALEEIGQVGVLLARETSEGLQLIDGHCRAELDAEQEWRVAVLDVDEKEAKKILATFDPISALAMTDEDKITSLLKSIEDRTEGLEDALHKKYLDNIVGPETAEPQIDRADALRKKWKVERGQMWKLGEHRLLCGDSSVGDNLKRLFGSERANILITDPPYGVSYASKNEFLNSVGRGNSIQKPIAGDHQTPEQMSVFWIAAFTALRGMLVPGAAYYVTGPQGGDLLLLLLALRESGYPLRHMLIWVKNNHVLGRCDYHYKHEPICYGWVDGIHKFYGGSSQFSTWEINKPNSSPLHPTMKPVELYIKAMENSSRVGDIVAEPFCGSGTSILASEQLGRRCRAMEIDPGYVAVTLQRYKDAFGEEPKREK